MPQARKRQSSSRTTSKQSNSRTTSRQNSSTQAKQDEADRYRRAAEDALQQLDWAIGYLHGIRKTEISKALANNRSHIRTKLMGAAEEPMPGQKTDET